MLHDINSKDKWSVSPYFRGVAGSGKSTLLKLLSKLYTDDKVGQLMSDGSSTFADEHLLDKHIVIANDLDTDTTFSVGRFNQLTSGETISSNRKFKTAINHTWHAPMAFASNVRPPWDDKAGNVARRLVIIEFCNAIRNSDMNLFDQCMAERPRFLVKIARLYLQAVKDFGTKSLWDKNILPQKFHDAKNRYLAECEPIAAVLCSNLITTDHTANISGTDFTIAGRAWLAERNVRAPFRTPSPVDHQHIFASSGGMVKRVDGVTTIYGYRFTADGLAFLASTKAKNAQAAAQK